MRGSDDPRNQSFHELIASLREQLAALVRAEFALAKAELSANGRQAVLGGGLLSAAAVLGLTAWLAMCAAAIAGIAEGLPVWASALIVGGALGAAAGLLALLGKARLARGMPPLRMTADTVRGELHDLQAVAARNGHSAADGAAADGPAAEAAAPPAVPGLADGSRLR